MKQVILALAFCSVFKAQVPNLLKDINTGSVSTKFGAFSLLPNNDVLFSVITPSSATAGLWLSDGSTVGTKMLKPYAGYEFTAYAGKTYYGVKNANGIAMWRSDGTVAGTDSLLTPGIHTASELRLVNNSLVFIGTNATNGLELWRTDGTQAGTYSLTGSASSIKTYSVVNNLLYFSLTNTLTGNELWRTDGTTSGTFLLKDIRTGTGSSFSTNPIKTIYSNLVFFQANDGVVGNELWKSDGTTVGTVLVKDIVTGSANTNLYEFFSGNNGIYFNANNVVNGIELWYSDGTTANTQMIRDVNPGSGSSSVTRMTFVGNNAYYLYSTIGSTNQPTFFKSNGTSARTTTLNLMAGTPTYTYLTSASVFNWNPFLYNNELYYVIERRELSSMPFPYWDTLYFYKSDLSISSKTLVARYVNHPTPASSSQTGAFENFMIGSKMFYTFKQTYDNTLSLVILNLANSQHKKYHNLGVATNGGKNYYTQFGNKLYYGNKVGDCEPGYIDLTTDSIYTLKDINTSGAGFNCSQAVINYWDYRIHKLNGKGYFVSYEPLFGVEWFETNFTPAGTFRVKDIYAGQKSFDDANLAATSTCYSEYMVFETPNNIFFGGNEGTNGFELWSFVNAPNNPNTVGLSNNELKNAQWSVYPNPGYQLFTIETKDAMMLSIRVSNALGALVYSGQPKPGANKEDINLGAFPAGIYFVTVNTDKGEFTKKIVKE